MMSKRLAILKNSLAKKETELDRRFDVHFADVRSVNGQPLNDKRNGRQTMDRWAKQNEGIRNQKQEIEKTKDAIEREQIKIANVNCAFETLPDYLKNLIVEGLLSQWRRYPHILFVNGVDKARIYFNEETGICSHKYVSQITCREQYAKFRDVFNSINAHQRAVNNERSN